MAQRPLRSPPAHLVAPVIVLLASPVAAPAQLLFDWPLRAEVVPEALIVGAAALSWNPAGTVGRDVGTELWLAHLDAPDATGLGGLAAAVTLDVPVLGRTGVSFRHLGVDDIEITSTSPLPDGGRIALSEESLSLALSRGAGAPATVGASLDYALARAGDERREQVSGTVGTRLRLEIPGSPNLGLALREIGTEPRLLFGIDAGLPPVRVDSLEVRVAWGVAAGLEEEGTEHRLAAGGTWRRTIRVGAGLTRHPDDGWTPLWMLGIDLGRYAFGVLREQSANGFGAAHHYRATIRM